ncbi:MAG: tRNA pseudouridine(55) synthase TruB [Desulfamplus sp.]|nr:tRNA pseudouridine(55) synthase TruB [Desulfamplus sp.]
MTKDGIIAIDKPEGISSAAVVARIKKKLGVKKVGHTGTLDPFATGLMLCGINKGTRLSQFFLGSSKSYIAEVILGIETDTQDCTGHLVKQCSSSVVNGLSHEMVMSTIYKFKGEMMQKPPVYSALKHNGQPIYKLARQGKPVQKPPRRIEIYSIEILQIKKISLSEILISAEIEKNLRDTESTEKRADSATTIENHSLSVAKFLSIFPTSESKGLNGLSVTFEVNCSSGTYIRSLAHDIGQSLGCGGTLYSLRRTRTCGFSIDDAVSLGKLEMMNKNEAFDRIVPMAHSLPSMPLIQADDALMDRISFGQTFFISYNHLFQESLSLSGRCQTLKPVQLSDSNNSTYMRVIDRQGELAAIIKYNRALDKYDYCCVFTN